MGSEIHGKVEIALWQFSLSLFKVKLTVKMGEALAICKKETR